MTLYELLTGKSPYSALSEVDILVAILAEDARPLREIDKNIPRDLEAVTLKCLEKEPEARYDSAKALAEDLTRYLDAEPDYRHRPHPTFARQIPVAAQKSPDPSHHSPAPDR